MPARFFSYDRHPAFKQCRVATESVDQKAFDHGVIFRGDNSLRADNLCNNAAAINIAEQDNRNIRCPRKAHIGDIIGPQIHFCRASGTLDQNKVGLGAKTGKAVEHGSHQARLPVLIFAGLRIPCYFALHDHLGPDHALGLQQHGVHMNRGRNTSGPGLQGLRATDLAAVRGDCRVV